MNSAIVITLAALVAVSNAGFLHAPAPLVTGYAAPAVVAHAPVAYAAPAIVKTHHAAVYAAPAPLVTGYAHAPVAYAAGPAIVKTHGIHGGAVLL